MARLILLNGPPGSGKSTLAQAYVDDHPLALNLDIDLVRRLLGLWQEHQEASGLLAREMALAMAREHLRAGHDVVIPQYVARLHFIEQVEELAVECNAEFHEIVLLGNRDASLRRVVRRSRGGRDTRSRRGAGPGRPQRRSPRPRADVRQAAARHRLAAAREDHRNGGRADRPGV
ncbi:MAG: AAA family ATPase [Nocardioidaceae bacterium]